MTNTTTGGEGTPAATDDSNNVPVPGLALRWTTLPPPLLGGSMGFLPCTDVRSTLRVCKTFRGARNAVQTLNIVKREEMDVPFAKQFVNVREVNIWVRKYKGNPDGTRGWAMDNNILQMTPMFLATFSHLETACVGDKDPHLGWEFYSFPQDREDPLVHRDIDAFCSFLGTLCNAYQSRALPKHCDLKILNPLNRAHAGGICVEGDEGHELCKKIFSCFPAKFCFWLPCKCTPPDERIRIMSGRSDMKAELMSSDFISNILTEWGSEVMTRNFLHRLGMYGFTCYLNFPPRYEIVDELWSRFGSRITTTTRNNSKFIQIWNYYPSHLRKLRAICALGADYRTVDTSSVWKELCRQNEVEVFILGKTSFDALVDMGFLISMDHPNLYVLDENKIVHNGDMPLKRYLESDAWAEL